MANSSTTDGSEDSPFLERDPIPTPEALHLLRGGRVELIGRMPYSSNHTFLVEITDGHLLVQGIYKPLAGEQPLWDFPDGLYQREVAAFVTSEALGWDVVPPTVVRDDLTHGIGSLQLFMPCIFEEHYFTLREQTDKYDDEFRRIGALDIVINNTDRKAGHCILGTEGKIWAIDHGVAFHHEFKLRTVIWDFAGEAIDDGMCDDLWRFLDDMPTEFDELLSPFERDAVKTRTTALGTAHRFPHDDTGGRRYPWPLV
ncbi:MAG: SCO1664 family protein [Acidimicrobiales bacterium]|nr:SCO1664 family protein [Acidimicrobiales bacterium]